MSRSVAYIGDLNVEKLHVQHTLDKKGASRYVVNMETGKSLNFRLTPDHLTFVNTRYMLDREREDSQDDNARRGQMVILNDDQVKVLSSIDAFIVKTAVTHSKEWFKKTLTEEEIKARYKPIVVKAKEEDTFSCMKFKVKCANSPLPTKLHKIGADDETVYPNKGTIQMMETMGTSLCPVLSSFGLWFMAGGLSFGLALQADEIIIKPGEGSNPLGSFVSTVPMKVKAEESGEEEEEGNAAKKQRVELEGDEPQGSAM